VFDSVPPCETPIYEKPRTSRPAPEHRTYPYLLRGLVIEWINQVWAADCFPSAESVLLWRRSSAGWPAIAAVILDFDLTANFKKIARWQIELI
jgi:hypothetical protein